MEEIRDRAHSMFISSSTDIAAEHEEVVLVYAPTKSRRRPYYVSCTNRELE